MYKGISPLKDKFNEQIFSEQITIIDNPKNTDCLSIANFDDEVSNFFKNFGGSRKICYDAS